MSEVKGRYYRPDELARDLHISRRTVYDWIRRGHIEALKLGRLLRISSEEYTKIMRNGVAPGKRSAPDVTVRTVSNRT